jgi:hypothetical protein
LKSTDIHIYLKFIFSISLLFILIACGLPVYESLEPPIAYQTDTYVVGFKTPDSETIDGYVLYYKIYNDGEDLITEDEDMFDPDYYYSYTLSDLPSGETLPEDLDFYQMGFVGDSTIQYPNIAWTGEGDVIQIDFTDALNQISDPTILVNDVTMTDEYGTPARYAKYISGSVDGTFKRFIKNYRYSEDDDINDVLDREGEILSTIEIAFVAMSYGISATDLQPLMSVPVYLGTVEIQSMEDAQEDPVLD